MDLKIIDSMMGTGKTSWAIEFMNALSDGCVLFVTPYLTETERIARGVTARKFAMPGEHHKKDDIRRMLAERCDVACSHELFRNLDTDCFQLIRDGAYTLILDETIEVIEPVECLKRGDVRLLQEAGQISITEDGRISWIGDEQASETRYDDFRKGLLSRDGYWVNGDGAVLLLPIEAFQCFCSVYVLTYLLRGSYMKCYFDYHHLEYSMYSIRRAEGHWDLIPFSPADLREYGKLIRVYDGKMNRDRQKPTRYSASWYEVNRSKLRQTRRDFYNFIRNIAQAKAEEAMWTCFKADKDRLKDKGYTGGFVSCNARATNAYRDRTVLIYGVNVYPNVLIESFFAAKGVPIDKEAYAWCQMAQWIWRSAIRDLKPIRIFIPSRRMREIMAAYIPSDDQASTNEVLE